MHKPKMHFSMPLITLLLLKMNLATQTSITELESCKLHLEHVITLVRNLVTTVEYIKPERCLMAKPINCAALLNEGNTESGIYTIYPKLLTGTLKDKLSVYCDMETDGGGWTVFQRRADYVPHQNFFQVWDTYKRGFGQLDKEFWLGNENIYMLTHQENVTLRVDLEDFEGVTQYATYDNFKIANNADKYRLHLGEYNGNAGDNLAYHDNMEFATWDNDNSHNCANRFKGGWWYNNCHYSNLNALYKNDPSEDATAVSWHGLRGEGYSRKKSEMKIRPTDFKKLT